MIPVTTHSTFAIDVPNRLLADARNGSMPAFERIYRLFERPVYTLALRLLGDRDEAQEILHDTMLKLFQNIDSYRGDSPFWGWLRQIAANESLMRLRKRARLAYVEDVPEPVEDEPSTLLPPAAADASRLVEAMQRLPDATRSVLWLYHAEGYTHEEIAGLMQRSVSFSKSQVARGTRRLRELLEVDEHAAA
ncbi:MAG: sigma-70 family RNA polymerase sigma factor [Rhodanobacteraceae bacterium]|nr:sigma-70 family RNA polymerase sigma factor [Rhodanobacteraceae bacterium]HPF73930.1 sigma-70 family RNA polymerase sigma factor [Xanthomonadaceae bacterium]HRY00306.1 sigma-70 family RNA polymerase sigma factor [Xanthomonadaceae bacterium]